MSLADLLLTASSSMWRSKARTFLTVIAIFIGAMTITLTNGIGTGIKGYLNKQIGNLGATNVLQIQPTVKTTAGPGTNTSTPAAYDPNQRAVVSSARGPGGDKQLLMSTKDLATIQAIPNITSVAPEHAVSPDYIAGTAGKYQLTLQQQFGSTTAALLAGNGVDNTSTQNQVTIPESYVGPLGYPGDQAIIGKPVTIAITSAAGSQSTVTATVTGVQQKAVIGGTAAYANSALSNQLYTLQSTGLPAASASSFTTADATFPVSLTGAQITTIKNQLSAKGYSGETIKDRENTIFTAINVIIIVFDLFGVIALLAASFGIINTLFMSVQERTREIGLMKALGMSPRRIFALFSIEAVLIGFWGSVLGVAFAALVGKVINTIGNHGFLKNFPGLSLLTFPLKTVLIVIVGIMLIAFLAGTLPALRASRKDPIDALRYE
jgi:putative ABC transport system permease protein